MRQRIGIFTACVLRGDLSVPNASLANILLSRILPDCVLPAADRRFLRTQCGLATGSGSHAQQVIFLAHFLRAQVRPSAGSRRAAAANRGACYFFRRWRNDATSVLVVHNFAVIPAL